MIFRFLWFRFEFGIAYIFLSLFVVGAALLIFALTTAGQTSPNLTAAFSPGNLAVCRVGDASTLLGNGATPVFIDEYTAAGSIVQSIVLPITVSGTTQRLTVSGNAVSECQITRSADGRYILMAGYNAPVGTLNLAASSSSTNPRVIGRIDVNGIVDTTTALTDAISGGSPRGAASTNGFDLWISGNGIGGAVSPIRYAALGSTVSTPLLSTPSNLRSVNIFDGQLFATSGTSTIRMAKVGTGTPATTGQTLAALPGIPSSVSLNAFFLADLDAGVADLDTLYAADDSGGMIRKYSFNGTTWAASGTVPLTGVTGLTGVVSGTGVTLYVTNSTSLRTLTDTSGYNGIINGTLAMLASPPDRTEFRSVAPVPVNVPVVTVNWGPAGYSRRVTLTASNSGPSVKRIYFKLPYATAFQSFDGNSARFKVVRNGHSWSFQAFVEDSSGNQSDVVTYTTP